MSRDVDVIVIGMGPGGEDVGGRLAEAGLEVIGIEAELVGGECPYWGCIPSKMMIRAANLLQEARRIPGIAGESTVSPDWSPVAARIREQATDDWDDKVAVDRFVGKGGIFVRGRGRFTGPRSVAVGGETYSARRGVVIATGTTAAIPPIPGLDAVDYWTNRDAVQAKELPKSMIVLGAGAIGAEIAQAYSRFGVRVTIVEALDRLLPLEEPEAGAVVAEAFQAEGIEVHTGVRATAVAKADGEDEVLVTLEGGGEASAQRLLVATGRRIDLSLIGAATAGLDESSQHLVVDEHLRAGDGIWGVGDVTGEGAFTHVAVYQSQIVAADILGQDHDPADYTSLPRVTFTDPEVGSVGLSEQAARDAGIDVAVAVKPVPHTAHGWLHATGNEGVIKLVVDKDRGVLVGATSAGPHGGEVLGHLALAVHAGIPIATLRSMIYAYPTFHRGILDALGDLEL